MVTIRTCLTLAFVSIWALPLVAAESGGLTVRVLDDQGAALAGVPVNLRHETGLVPERTLRTTASGRVVFAVLPARGGYVVTAVSGDRMARLTDLRIPPGGTVSVVLRPAAEPEGPGADARAHAVALDEVTGGPVLDRAFVEELPLPGFFYSKRLALTPGIQSDPGDLRAGAHGSRDRDMAIVVDGIRLGRDPLTPRFSSYVESGSIDQLGVLPAGAGVEFGGAQGGFVNVVGRDGSEDLHGTLDILYGTSELDGSGANRHPGGEPDFRSLHTAVHLSGPLLEDRLWFRLAWERADEETPLDVLRGIAVRPIERDAHLHRLTLQASPRNRLAIQYQSDPLEVGLFGIDSSLRAEASHRLDTESETGSVFWSAAYSPELLVQTSVAVQQRDSSLGPAIGGVPNGCVTGIERLEAGFCFPRGNDTSGSHFLDVDSDHSSLNLASRATWALGGRGSHQLRFGIEIMGENLDLTYEQRPILRPDPDGGFLRVLDTRVAFASASSVDARETSVYLEDRFRPVKNLTLTFGARVTREEFETVGLSPLDPQDELRRFLEAVQSGQQTQLAFIRTFTAFEGYAELIDEFSALLGVPTSFILGTLSNTVRASSFQEQRRIRENLDIANTNASPAFSASWNLRSDGRSRIAFSARRFFDRIDPVYPLLDTRPPATTIELEVAGTTLTGIDDAIGEVNVTTLDRGLETPYQDEWRLSFSHELLPETWVRTEYIRRDYRKQLQDTDINHAPGDFGRCRVATPSASQPLVPSPGAGFELTDPFSGEVYTDTDPGDGDGRLDDCAGLSELVVQGGGGFSVLLDRADGIVDRYVQNPFFNEVLLTGNFNRSDYEAAVLELVRREHRGWGLTASYVWSRHRGNAENLDPFLSLETARLDAVPGNQSTHRRHQARLAVGASLPRGLRVGGVISWESGLPYSIVEPHTALAPRHPALAFLGGARPSISALRYPTGERNDRRNAARWLVDLRLAREFDLGRGAAVRLSLDVFNALNDDTLAIYNPDLQLGLWIDGDVSHARREFGRRWQAGASLSF